MASITSEPNGRKSVQFVGVDGKRRTVRLGLASKRDAEAVKGRIERLVACQRANLPTDPETTAWLAGVPAELYGRLVAVGLAAPREGAAPCPALAEFLSTYIAGRSDVKGSTRENLEISARRLVEYFGSDRRIDAITPHDADGWKMWLIERDAKGRQRYADSTSGRSVTRARQFFRAAVRARLIEANPFQDVKPPARLNPARQFFVTREMSEKVLAACPDDGWRLVFLLLRYGGLRCPSDVAGLLWEEVDRERGRFLVHSPKTEHHPGGESRWVPIFPELREHFCGHNVFTKTGPIVPPERCGRMVLRRRFLSAVRKAGLKPWPKLFQNLRSTRETELAAEFPLHVVCSWLGNSPKIAGDHYLQVTEADYAKAVGPAPDPVQNAMQPGTACTGLALPGDAPDGIKTVVFSGVCEQTTPGGAVEVRLAQVEPFPAEAVHCETGGAFSGAVQPDPALARLVRAWPFLSQAVRNRILEMISDVAEAA